MGNFSLERPNSAGDRARLVLLFPVRDDWPSVSELIRRLDTQLAEYSRTIEIVMIDDGSVSEAPADIFAPRYQNIKGMQVLRLKRNLGHQRAIAVGIVYVSENIPCEAVAIMDSDGEDTPEGLMQLLHAFEENKRAVTVFASRSRRTESFLFRSGYLLFRLVHFLITGIRVRVGNFSVFPACNLKALSVMPDLWNHYAATVFRSRLPYTTVPVPRGHRIAGVSQMSMVSLVIHGLSAISVFGDLIGARMILLSLLLGLVSLVGVAILAVLLFTTAAVPASLEVLAGTIFMIATQFVLAAVNFTLLILNNRTNIGTVPLRDYALFIDSSKEIYRHE